MCHRLAGETIKWIRAGRMSTVDDMVARPQFLSILCVSEVVRTFFLAFIVVFPPFRFLLFSTVRFVGSYGEEIPIH